MRAPVSVELHLSAENGLAVADVCDLIARVSPLINEWRLCGLEELNLADRGRVLATLEQGQRFYHLAFARVPAQGVELLEELRGLQFFGSLLVDYCLEDDPHAGQNEAALREYIEQGLAVGVDVNARVLLDEWACTHLAEIVGAASDLGVNRIVCSRYTAGGRDKVGVPVLARAMDTVRRLQDESYSVSVNAEFPNCFSGLQERSCLAGVVAAFIDARGDLYPCRGSQCRVGNVVSGDLESLWQDPALAEWRGTLPPQCLECANRELCPGGNRAVGGEEQGDPLIGEALPSAVEALHEVVLEEDLCPKPLYATREEDFGWVLMRANQVIPVSFKAGEVLALFDGNHSLAEVERRFGAAALSFIYSLYVRGFVKLAERQCTGEDS